MEDQEDGLVLLGVDLVLDKLLVLPQQFGVKLNITRLVYTVNVTKPGGNGEVRADRREGVIDVVDILRLGVKRVVVNVLVVDAIFLSTRDTDFLRDSRSAVSATVWVESSKRTISSHCFIGAARFR